MNTLNKTYEDGVPPRYILFGSNYGWMATAEEQVTSKESIQECVVAARQSKLRCCLIVDRHDPRYPLFLDSAKDYAIIDAVSNWDVG